MRAIGVVLAGGNNTKMRELTEQRAIAAMPIAGSYRTIDFVLSNMTNSGIKKVGVLTQYNTKSLHKHLSSSKWWDFGRKQGGLFVFTPTITSDNSWWYRGTADALYQNISFLKHSHEPYVILASADAIYKMDYNKVLEYHIEKRADITLVVKEIEGEDVSQFGVIGMDEECRVHEFEEKPLMTNNHLLSCGIYVLRRRLLIELLERCAAEERYDFVHDILIRCKNIKRIYGYKLHSYWSNVATATSYFKTNMDFLKEDIRKHFFVDGKKIYTKIEDLAPAKYNPGSKIKNSLISSGCIINGEVDNSVIFRKVFVGNNCIIRNSIILNDVYIGDNTIIENCIVERGGTINANSSFVGDDSIRIVVEKNDRYIL